MRIVITGAAGFVGHRLAHALLTSDHELKEFKELVLVDVVMPTNPTDDRRVCCQMADLTRAGTIEALLESKTEILFHLAAVVSGRSEEDFDLGMRANLDVTRDLLEATRRHNPLCKLVFTSSVGVFAGQLPPVVTEQTAAIPVSSYGTQKAMSELMINDYTRKGFVDGRVVRLPTITVRSSAPNTAVTSFASDIIRDTLRGKPAVCQVSNDMSLWVSSPETLVKNLIHAAVIPATAFGGHRIVNLPGITVTVQQMIEALNDVAGPQPARLIRYEPNKEIDRIVSNVPAVFDVSRAYSMGFRVDNNFHDIITSFIKHDLK